MVKKFYHYPIESLIIIILIVAYFLPWIWWSKLTVSGLDLPFTYKKITNISNKIFFFSKKEYLYTAFYIYSNLILAILSGIFLLKGKIKLCRIFLSASVFNGLAISLYMFFYLISSGVLGLKNAGSGIYFLFGCSFMGLCYLISLWKIYYIKKKKSNRPCRNNITIPN